MSIDLRELWSEMRRRRVVSAAAAYLAVGFVLLQLAEILFPAFGLGPSAVRALLAVLLGGFPVAVALSWVYDVTRNGLRRTRAADTPDEVEFTQAPPTAVLVVVAMSAIALGLGGWWAVQGVEVSTAGGGTPSIAVLPFADMSPDGDQTYLGDGLAEEILNILAGMDGLRVAARTSSFAFRNALDDVPEIGRQLNVGWVVEGSVRRDGDEVRVTAQLIDTETGFHAWSANFDREMEGLFAVQDEIASAIVQSLLGELDLPGKRRGVVPQAATDAYWRGRAEWGRRDAAGLPSAIALFNEAIEIAPVYAEAYSGLADSYALLPLYVPSVDAIESLERAEDYANRAIELDPDLADPHASLGLVRALRQDRFGALEAFGRAVELNSSYAPALHWRANVLAEMGRLSQALVDAGRAATLDPLSPAVATDHANVLLWMGDTEGAKEELDRALSLDFGYGPALFGSALVALAESQAVPLQMALTQWAAVTGAPVRMASELTEAMLAFRGSGAPAPVPTALAELEQDRGAVTSGTVAALYALIGARQKTLEWLGHAVDDGSWIDQYVAVSPVYAPYRNDPAFRDIMTRISLGPAAGG